MLTNPDDDRHINLLRAELLDIGLVWNWHYYLIDEGTCWALDFLRPMTPEQYNRAEELLALIMNR
jgi:hypothetical protein